MLRKLGESGAVGEERVQLRIPDPDAQKHVVQMGHGLRNRRRRSDPADLVEAGRDREIDGAQDLLHRRIDQLKCAQVAGRTLGTPEAALVSGEAGAAGGVDGRAAAAQGVRGGGAAVVGQRLEPGIGGDRKAAAAVAVEVGADWEDGEEKGGTVLIGIASDEAALHRHLVERAAEADPFIVGDRGEANDRAVAETGTPGLRVGLRAITTHGGVH